MTDTDALLGRARALAPTLRARAPETEAARRVPAELSAELGRAGLYRMLAPAAVGGGEVPPAVFAAALEALAVGDGAPAWVAMTASTTGHLLAWLEPDVARAVLDETGDAALAGVFAPMGRAVPDGDGYRVAGRWPWASGVDNARWRMGGALVMDGDAPRTLPGGAPEIRSCFFRADAARVEDTWHTSGLRGTGSHDLVVEGAWVPAAHTTCLLADPPRHDGPLQRFPVFGLLATGVCAVGLGLGRAALDHVTELVATRRSRGGKKRMGESELVQVELARAEGALRAARALVFTTLDRVWETASAGGALTASDRADLRLAATHAARTSAEVVDATWRLAGGAAVWESGPLQRIHRDVHVMTQHVMVGPETLKPVGRILAGLDADVSML